MVVDFSALDYQEGPLLILRNLDGTPIQPLGYAYNVTAKLMYNEVSELSFEIPAYVNGQQVPYYDAVTGMRIVDLVGVGQFILSNPKTEADGIKEYKQCTAYSLEYELTYKKIFLEEGTYNFWNPVARENTVLGIILDLFPSWAPGSIDESLWGKYRTFSVDNDSAYDFIKGTLQKTYQCIFDFDTYERKINVRAVTSHISVQPIYLSLDNLIKELSVEEDTENIFTCIDVNGADGVDIRSVNPMGINKIYNLDHFMVLSNFPQKMIDQWNSWKQTYQNKQELYFNITIEKTLEESKLETARAALMSLEGDLQKYETLQSAYVEASAQGIDRNAELADIKKKITEQKELIRRKKDEISETQKEIDALFASQKEINQECSFNAFFSPDELVILDRYIKEDAIAEESFVYRSVPSYTDEDVSKSVQNVSIDFQKANVTRVRNTTHKEIYSIIGGTLSATVDGDTISAGVIRAAIEVKPSKEYIVTAYLGSGTFQKINFPGGCISLVGSGASIKTDVKPDPDISASYMEGTFVSVASSASNLYFTMNATEYAKRSIEWDLFEYGQECLRELCYPSYTFSVDSSNFLALDEFLRFKNKFRLGDKVYLELNEDQHLSPIVIGAEIESEDPSKLKLLFGDKYSASDSAFELVDLLEQSVSMGKTVASNKNNFNAFIESGASTSVKDFISSALDVSKNKVLSSTGQSIQWDESGLRLRKQNASSTDYDPEQIWMINNSIVFTDDGWSTAKMALGKFTDKNTGDTWGLVAPAIVGTLLAGSNLVIESAKQDGGVAVFRVDADGAKLYNSRFDLVNEYSPGNLGQISMAPPVGLVGGNTTTSMPLFSYDGLGNANGVLTASGTIMRDLTAFNKKDLPRASFWIDMLGNAYLKGNIYATDGIFNGTVYAKDGSFTGTVYATAGEFSGTLKATTLEGTLVGANGGAIKGVSLGIGGPNYNNFMVDSAGNVTMNGSINLSGGRIYWGNNLPETGISRDEAIDLIDRYGDKVPNYIRSTWIDSVEIQSPTITGNDIVAKRAFNVDGRGYMGRARGAVIRDDGWGPVSSETYGVAMAAGAAINDGTITFDSIGNYVIVTNAGVRMTCNNGGSQRHELTVTANGCFADGKPIGSSSGGNVTAVWGA